MVNCTLHTVCPQLQKTYHGDQWVTMEMIVYNDSLIHHVVEGDTVLTYTGIVVGGNVNPEPNILQDH